MSSLFEQDVIVTLEGKTDQGKAKVILYGKEWQVLRADKTYHMSDKEGPWLFIRPKYGQVTKVQWIHLLQDPNYKVLSIKRGLRHEAI